MADESNTAEVNMADESNTAEANKPSATTTEESSVEEQTAEDYFFHLYSEYNIHEEMLKDKVRTNAFREAMTHNKHLFKGKTVLDVGCGTGILSLFAASSGAAKVIAIDGARIIDHAKQIVIDNKFQDVIKVVKGKVEEVELPDGIEKVDIIVSNWMGYCLFHGSMLDTVIFARDKWLKPNGLIFPDHASLHITAVENVEYKRERIDWWKDVYGFNMSCIRKIAMIEPAVEIVPSKHIASSTYLLKEVDLYTLKKDDIAFSSPFILTMTRSDSVEALLVYFEIEFTKTHTYIGFSTSPESDSTYWKQTMFFLQTPLKAKIHEEIHGTFKMKQNKRNHRDLDFVLNIKFGGALSHVYESSMYRMR